MQPVSDVLCVVVSRDDICRQDVSSPLSTLQHLLRTPEIARAYKERVDIAFDGYNDDPRELHEIEEVRNFVQKLDEEFPFWLFFLSKHMLGLQCIVFCHLLPFLTDEAQAEHHPRQLQELLLTRWFPAMNHVAEYAELSEKDIEEMTERFAMYIKFGKLTGQLHQRIKPDLGLQLSKEGVDSDVLFCFYDVPFQSVDFLSPGSYSVMLEKEHGGKIHAVSFDFDDKVFSHLVSAIPQSQRTSFSRSLIGQSFPFSANLPKPVVAKVVECRLSTIQKGARDSFIPLAISRIELAR
jgi:hypothetical protein